MNKRLRSFVIASGVLLVAGLAFASPMSLGSGPTSVGPLTGSSPSWGTPVATSSGNNVHCTSQGIYVDWFADIYSDSNGGYDVRYHLRNHKTSADPSGFNNATNAAISIVETTDFSTDGTVGVDGDTSYAAYPGEATRSSGDATISWTFNTTGGSTITSGSIAEFYVQATNAIGYASGGSITVYIPGNPGPCVLTTAAEHPHG